MPRSIIAIVVPTGALPCISPTFMSAIDAKRLPESTRVPNREYRVWEGSLNGKGMIACLKSIPTMSTSLNSPGLRGVSSSLILAPLALNPAGRLDNVPASINCLSIDVEALDKPPIICVRPKP